MKIVLLAGAEQDLIELRRYVLKNFGRHAWNSSYLQIKTAIRSLRDFPLGGAIPDEVSELQIGQFRQVIAGMNRIVYEVLGDTVYIHIICDTRRQLRSILARRLLRAK
ncbi:type II toxin-antitoxin system RelE/ParE family toxin [Pseudoduganella sp. OTU4001]|uniref:type II toxin-antitoxin system RelE/ParE family toxin n=1 Tax=Pseudoduganella sp. OTU4001 TaxID=3043854 RepID=UPI00313C87C4